MSMTKREKRTTEEKALFKHGGQAAVDKYRDIQLRKAQRLLRVTEAKIADRKLMEGAKSELTDADIEKLAEGLKVWKSSLKAKKQTLMSRVKSPFTSTALLNTLGNELLEKLYLDLLKYLDELCPQVTVKNIRDMEARLSRLGDAGWGSIKDKLARPPKGYSKDPVAEIGDEFAKWALEIPLDEKKMIGSLCLLQKEILAPEVQEDSAVTRQIEKGHNRERKAAGKDILAANALARIAAFAHNGSAQIDWETARQISDLYQKYQQKYQTLEMQQKLAVDIRQKMMALVFESVLKESEESGDEQSASLAIEFSQAATADAKLLVVNKAITGLQAINVPEKAGGHVFVFKPFLDKLIKQEVDKLQKMQGSLKPSVMGSLLSRLNGGDAGAGAGASVSASPAGAASSSASSSSWFPSLSRARGVAISSPPTPAEGGVPGVKSGKFQ